MKVRKIWLEMMGEYQQEQLDYYFGIKLLFSLYSLDDPYDRSYHFGIKPLF